MKEKVINKYKTLKKLQEENERLKEQSYINLERNIEAYKIVEDYEQRIKKAVDYIKEHIRIDDEYPAYMEMLIEERDNLLNILNGENDKSKGE